jgi:CelD/BcsL family acetyltransferase involved in cellulose biosynthesis
MKTFSVLEFDWALALLDDLRRGSAEGCRGTLSALWAGDQLVAAHLGIRNQHVIHWWFTAYDASYEQYSPGAVLLLRLIEESARLGMRRLDLGRGKEEYKASFQSGAIALAEGAIARTAGRRAVQRVAYRLRQWVRSSWLRGPTQRVKAVLRANGLIQ